MNIDLAASFRYGDVQGLHQFMLDHRFIHEATATALTARFSVSVSTFGMGSSSAEAAWAALMGSGGEEVQTPLSLHDWLQFHAQVHAKTYALLNGSDAPDLSEVDFAREDQFTDWMYAHQSVHDFEQSALGLV